MKILQYEIWKQDDPPGLLHYVGTTTTLSNALFIMSALESDGADPRLEATYVERVEKIQIGQAKS